MNTTPSPGTIEELAKRAIETRKAFIETDLPEGSIGHSMLFADGVATNTAYHSAATPEAWLTLSARVRELEEALKEARSNALEEAAALCADFSWGADIDWWLNATKKDVSAKTCLECAAAIRALSPKTTDGGE